MGEGQRLETFVRHLARAGEFCCPECGRQTTEKELTCTVALGWTCRTCATAEQLSRKGEE